MESDTSGGTIVQYQFWDTDTGGTGHFTLNDVVEANDQGFTVTSDQLSQLSYQIVSGTQIIYVRANDGTLTDPNWGAWSAGITVTAPAPLPAAVFTPAHTAITATRDQIFSTPASLWTESDTSGGTIVQYQFWDTDTGGTGHFTLNGVVEANDQGFTVTPGQLSTLSYQIVSGTQIIYVRANDGTLTDPNWGAWSAGITVTAPPATQAAVFTPVSATVTAPHNQVFSTPASLWTESDTSGGTIAQYQFWDTDTQGGLGNFTLNGVVEANDQGFTVTPDQLSELSYQIVSGTQVIYVRANDGTLTDPNWGAWSAGITVTAVAPVFTPVSANITATRDQVFSTPASLWTESDALGRSIAQYQFWDTDTGGTGHFTLNGVVEANDQGFTVTPAQLSTLSYQIVSGTQVIYVRANDGTLTDPNWGAWSSGITVTAPAQQAALTTATAQSFAYGSTGADPIDLTNPGEASKPTAQSAPNLSFPAQDLSLNAAAKSVVTPISLLGPSLHQQTTLFALSHL
jgi:archaeosine-15-forming tRNA-guanine transglycosylase